MYRQVAIPPCPLPLTVSESDCSAFSKARLMSLTLTQRRLSCFPKTSSNSRELEPGSGDLGVSEVVLQSSKSACKC